MQKDSKSQLSKRMKNLKADSFFIYKKILQSRILYCNSYSTRIKYDIMKMKNYVYKGIKYDINL